MKMSNTFDFPLSETGWWLVGISIDMTSHAAKMKKMLEDDPSSVLRELDNNAGFKCQERYFNDR